MRTYTAQDIAHFWSYVRVGKPDECWPWLGCTSAAGGGTKRAFFCLHSKSTNAARFAYWFTTGIWPGELDVCHSCDNKLCVNPGHLFLGTAKDNMQDAARKGRLKGRHVPQKLTETEVCEIRVKYAAGSKQQQLAMLYGVTQVAISNIVRRKNWKHVK